MRDRRGTDQSASVRCCGRRFESALTVFASELDFALLSAAAARHHIQLWIDGAVGSFYKAAILLVAFENRDPKMLAVRSHLHDINCQWPGSRDTLFGRSIAIAFRGAILSAIPDVANEVSSN